MKNSNVIKRRNKLKFLWKRCFDIWLSLVLLILFLPLLLVTSLAIYALMGRPIFFIQERPGKDGKIFKIVKFRTMKLGNEPDEQRITNLGKLIRRFSIDEIPQLINVLFGDMSFVGPRPLLKEYLPLYNSFQVRRHEVLPGITGWAQINGRNALSWEDNFRLDVWYVDNFSISLDLKIIILTIIKVLKGAGVSQEKYVSRPKFTGNK